MALQRPEVFLVDEVIMEGSHLTHHMAPQGFLTVNEEKLFSCKLDA